MPSRPAKQHTPFWSGFRLSGFSLFAVCTFGSVVWASEATLNTIHQGSHERTYHLYVPPSYSPEEPAPLVLSLHGRGSTGQRQMDGSGMNEVADREGFLVVYPNAIDRSWSNHAELTVGFVDSILDDVRRSFAVDSTRIYATGASQGAVVTYLLGVERPHLFAAIAPNAGLRPSLADGGLHPVPVPNLPSRPMPLMHVHGTADATIPFYGGSGFPSVDATLTEWSDSNQCEPTPSSIELEGAESVTLFQYENCDEYTAASGETHAAEVALYQVNGGGHTWPKEASSAVWDFFARHQLPEASLNRVAPGKDYFQDFNSIPGSDAGNVLPLGWSATGRGAITTAAFPPKRRIQNWQVYAAGEGTSSDQALAVGVSSTSVPMTPQLQLLTQVDSEEIAAFQLDFDIEPWFADKRAEETGEAAFDVTVEVDSGEGFSALRSFEAITGGTITRPEDGGVMDGNSGDGRSRFSSGSQITSLPAGSTLRIRWAIPEDTSSKGWVFGIDNVRLRLFDTFSSAFDCNEDGHLGVADLNCANPYSLDDTLAAADLIQGDLDGNGAVEFADFLALAESYGGSGQYTDGDLDLDGHVLFSDFLSLAGNFGKTNRAPSAVPEPSSVAVAFLALASLLRHCRKQWLLSRRLPR